MARYTDKFYSHEQFYHDAAAGELPEFSWLNCVAEAADHPCSDMAKGERCQKDVYEALRAGPVEALAPSRIHPTPRRLLYRPFRVNLRRERGNTHGFLL